jgi:hydrophobe/amphiphile efflux-1 (HAE1) family protein
MGVNFSKPFIERPIATTLLSIGLFLIGLLAYFNLPVSSMPSISFPTISVNANRPGADPETMAATIAAPLERRLGEIAGVTEMTSVNSLGSTRITIQFDIKRNIEGAARDVQAALNAAASELPSDIPTLPSFRKANPNAAPILIVALTSKTIPASAIFDVADTVIVQRLSQIEGVAEVNASGADQPAIRIRLNPSMLASMGVSTEEVRQAVTAANAVTPLGAIDGPERMTVVETNAQLRTVEDYKSIVVKTVGGTIIRVANVAQVEAGTRNARSAALFNRDPSVLLIITKQAEANVIDTVDRIKAQIPEIKRWVPEAIEFSILTDRTTTIRASVKDMQITLVLSIALVMVVVFVFMRRGVPTIAAGITVPLSLAGTCAAMWLAGYSINNLTLMALVVSVGFVVDDAIVMIENMYRNLEEGLTPLQAALRGAQQIGFTVISISISLLAAFIPLLFMTGIMGRLLREFSMTLAFAVIISTVVSLSVTPMICARFIKSTIDPRATLFDRIMEAIMGAITRAYAVSLRYALERRALMMLVTLATIIVTVQLYIKTPKGYIPADDTGLVFASTRAAPDISFEAMNVLQRQALEIVLADPAVSGVGSSIGASTFNASVNQGRMFVSLKPLAERGGITTVQFVDRMRRALYPVRGLDVFMSASQDIRVGARQGRASYQFTLWSTDIDELYAWVPKALEALQKVEGLADVSMDREQGGLQASIKVDRQAAARLGVRIQDIDTALNNAFAQRQVSVIYTPRNQYRVILEADPLVQRDPSQIERVHVPGRGGVQVPLGSVIRVQRGLAPLVINHQGPFPAATLTYNLKEGVTLQAASQLIDQAIAQLRMPDTVRTEAAGDAKAAALQASAQPLLILAALLTVYIVLGVLYESLAHPLTIISTLPSAGLGALLALNWWDMELSAIAMIGIILLIGIVKKNGIMLVDFALDAERQRGLAPAAAIYEACIERFRPILMTTLAAVLGAIPLAIAEGPGSELRRPLGITIIGGLIVSQILTLYTTPVIYLMLGRLHQRLWGDVSAAGSEPVSQPAAGPVRADATPAE